MSGVQNQTIEKFFVVEEPGSCLSIILAIIGTVVVIAIAVLVYCYCSRRSSSDDGYKKIGVDEIVYN